MHSYTRGTRWRRGLRAVLTLAVLLPAAACEVDELLDVDDDDIVNPPVFTDPENLPAVYAGAVREFARAYAGEYNGEGGLILQTGMFTDELFNADNFSDRQAIDARNMSTVNDANETAFSWLQRARNHAELALDLLEAGVTEEQDWSAERSELLSLAGFSYMLFGEAYCGAVPFSRTTQTGKVEHGAAETTQQIFDRALARFDAALALAPGEDLENLALIGRARTLLNLAQTPEDVSAAAAILADIPTDFSYDVGYSEAITTSSNAVWQLTNAEKRWSVADLEGTNGLPFFSADDPRTPASISPGGGFATDLHYNELKYPEQGSDIPLATGVEARLIEAEAALRNDDRVGFFTIHNALRDGVPGLADLVDTGQTEAELVDLHFRERAFWLWLTAHRLGDLRRLIRQYDRTEDTVFPIGPTVQDVSRGNQVSLPVPFEEENNPLYDPSACVTTVP